MKLLNIKLRGFIGVKKGLGLDEVGIDLSNLSGLIALDGPNGSSKTTILESLQPYRMLASRKKALQHHVFLRDSAKDLSFLFEGNEYRTLVKIDSESEKQEGFVWKNGKPQVDGKAMEYDRYLVNLLGSSNLFFNSVFCAQNSDRISDMTTGKLKDLFSEFLRLDRLVQYESTSKQCGNILTGSIESVNRTIEKLNDSLSKESGIKSGLEEWIASGAAHQKNIGKLQTDLKVTEEGLKLDQGTIKENELLRQRVKSLENTKILAKKDIEADGDQKEKELSEIRIKAEEAISEINDCKKLVEEGAQVEEAIAQEQEIREKIADIRPKLEKINETLLQIATTANEKEKNHTQMSAELQYLKRDSKTKLMEAEITALKEQMSDLDKRDPKCKSSTCSFIIKALAAQDKLPGLGIELTAMVKDLAVKKTGIEKDLELVATQFRELKGKQIEEIDLRDHYKKILSSLESNLSAIKGITEKAGKVKEAETKLRFLRKQKQQFLDDGLKVQKTWDDRIFDKEKRLIETLDLIEIAKKGIDTDADDRAEEREAIIKDFEKRIVVTEKELQEITKNIAILEAELKEIEKSRKDLGAVRTEKTQIATEISEWSHIKHACSKDGLQALEIDSVAPVITGYANDLLAQTFGPSFSVRFRTQDEETGREILDILVIREDGSEVLLDNLSGGEKVWNLKALRLAMTLVAKEKSGKNFLTSLADEEDGALDVENAMNFIALYRAFMKTGGFDDCFYITHKTECITLADHVIRFNGNGIEVE